MFDIWGDGDGLILEAFDSAATTASDVASVVGWRIRQYGIPKPIIGTASLAASHNHRPPTFALPLPCVPLVHISTLRCFRCWSLPATSPTRNVRKPNCGLAETFWGWNAICRTALLEKAATELPCRVMQFLCVHGLIVLLFLNFIRTHSAIKEIVTEFLDQFFKWTTATIDHQQKT